MPSPPPTVALAYPRTGKRGVPQQFPRRLYEMLESEAKIVESTNPDYYGALISWSDSGRAFRIHDVALFAKFILPKYFRTNKFSSFQRNLNLYGFAKVRRGPDTDQYGHPAFLRGYPELLNHLRKCSNATGRRRIIVGPKTNTESSFGEQAIPFIAVSQRRPVSPSPPKVIVGSSSPPTLISCDDAETSCKRPSPQRQHDFPSSSLCVGSFLGSTPGRAGGGKLELLAMALSSIAEQEAAV